MDIKKMTGNSSKCLRERPLDASPCHHTTSISVTTAWSPRKDPPGELSVYRGRSGAKGKSILFPPHFFQDPVQP